MPRETGKHVAGGTPKEKKPKKPSRLTRQQKILLAGVICLAGALAVGVLLVSSGARLLNAGARRRRRH